MTKSNSDTAIKNRVIRFRGMTLNGEWVYGNLSVLSDPLHTIDSGSYISNSAGSPFAFKVRPETIEQFTGLHDKNGKGIFEGDIVQVGGNPYRSIIEYVSGENTWKEFNVGGVFVYSHIVGREHSNGVDWDLIETNAKRDKRAFCEVIGNVHENPELLNNE